jgi:hypothetical protein
MSEKSERKRGGPENKSPHKSFQVTLPREHYDHLTALAEIGRYGAIESDVAVQILIRELDNMRALQDHLKLPPQPKVSVFTMPPQSSDDGNQS